MARTTLVLDATTRVGRTVATPWPGLSSLHGGRECGVAVGLVDAVRRAGSRH